MKSMYLILSVFSLLAFPALSAEVSEESKSNCEQLLRSKKMYYVLLDNESSSESLAVILLEQEDAERVKVLANIAN